MGLDSKGIKPKPTQNQLFNSKTDLIPKRKDSKGKNPDLVLDAKGKSFFNSKSDLKFHTGAYILSKMQKSEEPIHISGQFPCNKDNSLNLSYLLKKVRSYEVAIN